MGTNIEKKDRVYDKDKPITYYKIRFRAAQQTYSATADIPDLTPGESVMVETEHDLEPAEIKGPTPFISEIAEKESESGVWTNDLYYHIKRRADDREKRKYEVLPEEEKEAFRFCKKEIIKMGLAMKLIRVTRFFNGSKIIFFFTAENRIDFRELVKKLVQKYSTRVEMRQVGVRHECQMIGGIGCCGRELCCSSYIKSFVPVSIKMAKVQDLPLNPTKISGICNRLLCCLTYEFDSYHKIKKEMPKIGSQLRIDQREYIISQITPLEETVTVQEKNTSESPQVLERKVWEPALKKENRKTRKNKQKAAENRNGEK
ncbi:MAG: PSP1 domain-containing protein [Thermodesulfobacteriota bacterium]